MQICTVVTASNGIPFLLTNLLDYVNQFFLQKGIVAKRNSTVFAKMAAVPGGNGWGLVINNSCNGCQWKLH